MAWISDASKEQKITTRKEVRRRTKIFVGSTSAAQYEDITTEEYYIPALTQEYARNVIEKYKNKGNTTAVMSRQNDCGAYRVDVSERTVEDVTAS